MEAAGHFCLMPTLTNDDTPVMMIGVTLAKGQYMNTTTWLDLYNFLYKQANDINNLGKFDWNEPVIIYDADTGNEYISEPYFMSSHNKKENFVLTINSDQI